MLTLKYYSDKIEAGCDEAGRGCLAGPVFAAAVILPENFSNEMLNDSKQLSEKKRNELRIIIEREALAWAVAAVDNEEIDKINILNASIEGMHRALAQLSVTPQHILVDGTRFKPYGGIEHHCIIKGDIKSSSLNSSINSSIGISFMPADTWQSLPPRYLRRLTGTSTCNNCTNATPCTTGQVTRATPPRNTGKASRHTVSPRSIVAASPCLIPS